MLRLARRDLADACVPGLSADRQFLIAYDAALALSTIPLLCAGYQTHGTGHHWIIFQALPFTLGREFADLATYLESYRTKRNVGTCDRGGEMSETEAMELHSEVTSFKSEVEQWLRTTHPRLC